MADALKRTGFVVKLRAARTKPSKPRTRSVGALVPPFALFDPKRRTCTSRQRKFAKHDPCISFFDGFDAPRKLVPEQRPARADDQLDVTTISNRLHALEHALQDLPTQAKRLLQMQARRGASGKGTVQPIRRGNPPGHRARGKWPVDQALRECHQMALTTMAAPDTS